ncbi:MAG: DUF5317 domain-containing protein [Chloroflexi bacterium]|nr:DUF5317 domain-containing protein [Chloroflexota bacterium]
MILAYAIICLLVLALLLRRDISAIGKMSYRGGWQAVAAVAGLFIVQWFAVIYAVERTVFQMSLLILSHIALILLFLLNRHVPGAKLFTLGIILNTVVMVANGGWMPVTPETYRYVHPDQTAEVSAKPIKSKNIVLPRTETKLWVLSDIIPVALPWRRYSISLGDIVMVLGVAQFLFQTTSKKQAGDVPVENYGPSSDSDESSGLGLIIMGM